MDAREKRKKTRQFFFVRVFSSLPLFLDFETSWALTRVRIDPKVRLYHNETRLRGRRRDVRGRRTLLLLELKLELVGCWITGGGGWGGESGG